jgi:hypothetical protein
VSCHPPLPTIDEPSPDRGAVDLHRVHTCILETSDHTAREEALLGRAERDVRRRATSPGNPDLPAVTVHEVASDARLSPEPGVQDLVVQALGSFGNGKHEDVLAELLDE